MQSDFSIGHTPLKQSCKVAQPNVLTEQVFCKYNLIFHSSAPKDFYLAFSFTG